MASLTVLRPIRPRIGVQEVEELQQCVFREPHDDELVADGLQRIISTTLYEKRKHQQNVHE